MRDKQHLRNTLCAIEDDARRARRTLLEKRDIDHMDVVQTLTLIARLAQIVREDVVQ